MQGLWAEGGAGALAGAGGGRGEGLTAHVWLACRSAWLAAPSAASTAWSTLL